MSRGIKAPFQLYEGRKSKDKHIRLTSDMMLHEKYLKLSSSAKEVYNYMKLWSLGNEEFEYPLSLATKFMAKNTFLRAKDELLENQFIELIEYNKFTRLKTKYKFTQKWYQ